MFAEMAFTWQVGGSIALFLPLSKEEYLSFGRGDFCPQQEPLFVRHGNVKSCIVLSLNDMHARKHFWEC